MDRRLHVFHALVVGGAAATVIFSWALWQTRTEPPLIPLLPLPEISSGFLLLGALAFALADPTRGLAAYCVVLTYAVVSDWTRLQPAMISFAVLMAAAVPGRAGPMIARVHLLSLWFYAGLHKLLSPEFMAYRGDISMLRSLFTQPPQWLGAMYPEFVVVTEIGLAIVATIPRTRQLSAVWALLLHATILLSLSGRNWNKSVWAWNVVLALAGIVLIAPWKESLRAAWSAQSPTVRVALLLMLVFPLLSQLGIGDPYLAHHLYSRSTPISYVCRSDATPPPRPGLGNAFESTTDQYCRYVDYFPWLKVPEPGEHAFVRAYFARTCAEGDRLLIRERRWFFIAIGREWTSVACAPADDSRNAD